MKQGSKIIGAFSADQIYDSGQPLEDDLGLLQTVATMIAQAVWRHRELQKERHALWKKTDVSTMSPRAATAHRISLVTRKMQVVYDHISRVGTSDCTVLIRGESGVGKELVSSNPLRKLTLVAALVKVNCAALTESSRVSSGTNKAHLRVPPSNVSVVLNGQPVYFLDEIGDFPMSTQIMLLRFLQEREFERVGGGKQPSRRSYYRSDQPKS